MEEFSSGEIELIMNSEVLHTKASALAKVNHLLSETRQVLKECIEQMQFSFPANTNLLSGKISIGENYRGLPYQVLDYPAKFTAEDTFAFRTMFWWGNFFSSTLYLQGESLDRYRSILLKNKDMLQGKDIYICVHDSPWEHHFESDNYRILENNLQYLEKHPFLKLAVKWEISEFKTLPVQVKEYFEMLVAFLSDY